MLRIPAGSAGVGIRHFVLIPRCQPTPAAGRSVNGAMPERDPRRRHAGCAVRAEQPVVAAEVIAAASWRARRSAISMPWSAAVAMARRSGGWPTCQSPVPAESSTTRPANVDTSMRARSTPFGHRRAADVAQADDQQANRFIAALRHEGWRCALRHGRGLRAYPRRAETPQASWPPRCGSRLRARAVVPAIRSAPAGPAAAPRSAAGIRRDRHRCRCGAASARRSGNCVRSRANASRGHGIGARLKYSASPLPACDQLDRVGVEQRLGVGRSARPASPSPRRCRAAAAATARMPAAGAKGSSPCRFTTMVSSLQPAMRAHSARRSVPEAWRGRGHRHAHAAAGERVGDALVVGGDPDFARAGRQRAARDVQHQRFAGEQAQRLARQARGGVTRGDGDDEISPWRKSCTLCRRGAAQYVARACARSAIAAARPRMPPATRARTGTLK